MEGSKQQSKRGGGGLKKEILINIGLSWKFIKRLVLVINYLVHVERKVHTTQIH